MSRSREDEMRERIRQVWGKMSDDIMREAYTVPPQYPYTTQPYRSPYDNGAVIEGTCKVIEIRDRQ